MKNTIAGAALANFQVILAAFVVLITCGSLHAADLPSAEAQPSDIARLIAELGSDEFVTRRRAERALVRLGTQAFEALEQAENDRDVEIAARATYLLQGVDVQWVRDDDSPNVRSELRHYGEMFEEDRQSTIARLAKLRDDEGLKALCRIVRFEKSQVNSKLAALAVLRPKPRAAVRPSERGQVVRQAMGRSQRPAAKWLAAYVQSLEDPHSALEAWDKVIDAEQVALDGLSDVIQDVIMARLMYTIAQIHSIEGRGERAEELAGRAFAVREQDPVAHVDLAQKLNARGLTDWAEREFRHVMKLSPAGASDSRVPEVLAQMLHDRQRSQAAAEVLAEAVKAGRGPADSIRRAQMEYYLAEHFAKAGDLAAQREHLDLAVKHDPNNADILIAMYRLPGADEAYRKRTLTLLNNTAGKMEQRIKQVEQVINQPENVITLAQRSVAANAYNQWAWLIGNTEGDRDKAVKYSHKSLELAPNLASYLDTLGHCYFGNGDYDNAVKYQQQAADLEPYTQAINRPLARFKRALAESKQRGQ